MNGYEIYKSYKGAKNPKMQISILADLNNCSKKTIEKIIERQQNIEKDKEKEFERLRNEEEIRKFHKKESENVIFTQCEGTSDDIEARMELLDALITKYTKEYKSLCKLIGAAV